MRVSRAGRLLALVFMLTLFTGSTGRAGANDAVTLAVSGISWFWADQLEPPPNTIQQSLPTPDVPKGDFAVAMRNGQSNKESFLHFDSSVIADGSLVDKLVLTLKEDVAAPGDAASAAAAVIAVPASDFWADGAAGNPYSQEPGKAKSAGAKGTRATDGTWTFDITAIASAWASGALPNNGIALIPDLAAAAPAYEVVWLGTPVPEAKGEVTPPTTASSSSSDFSSSFSASTTDTTPSTSFDSSGSSSPTFSPPSFSPPTPVASAPTTRPSTPRVTGVAAPATTGRSKHGLPVVFLPAVLAGVAALALGAVALGDSGEPTSRRQGSVLRRLERRGDVAG